MNIAALRPGSRFSRYERLSEEVISAFAEGAGDHNPLHHDREFATSSRYGYIIASGPQTSALLMAQTATYFSQFGSMVGLEFWFGFKRAVKCSERIKLEWLIIQNTPSQKLRGDIIDLRGRIINEKGVTAVGAKGRVLLMHEH